MKAGLTFVFSMIRAVLGAFCAMFAVEGAVEIGRSLSAGNGANILLGIAVIVLALYAFGSFVMSIKRPKLITVVFFLASLGQVFVWFAVANTGLESERPLIIAAGIFGFLISLIVLKNWSVLVARAQTNLAAEEF